MPVVNHVTKNTNNYTHIYDSGFDDNNDNITTTIARVTPNPYRPHAYVCGHASGHQGTIKLLGLRLSSPLPHLRVGRLTSATLKSSLTYQGGDDQALRLSEVPTDPVTTLSPHGEALIPAVASLEVPTDPVTTLPPHGEALIPAVDTLVSPCLSHMTRIEAHVRRSIDVPTQTDHSLTFNNRATRSSVGLAVLTTRPRFTEPPPFPRLRLRTRVGTSGDHQAAGSAAHVTTPAPQGRETDSCDTQVISRLPPRGNDQALRLAGTTTDPVTTLSPQGGALIPAVVALGGPLTRTLRSHIRVGHCYRPWPQ